MIKIINNIYNDDDDYHYGSIHFYAFYKVEQVSSFYTVNRLHVATHKCNLTTLAFWVFQTALTYLHLSANTLTTSFVKRDQFRCQNEAVSHFYNGISHRYFGVGP